MLKSVKPPHAELWCGARWSALRVWVESPSYFELYFRSSVDDILNKGDFAKIRDFDINDYSALVSKFEAEQVFATELLESQIDNVAAFMMKGMPSEVVMKVWSLLGQTGGEEQKNLLKIHNTCVDGRTFSDFLVEMLGDQE